MPEYCVEVQVDIESGHASSIEMLFTDGETECPSVYRPLVLSELRQFAQRSCAWNGTGPIPDGTYSFVVPANTIDETIELVGAIMTSKGAEPAIPLFLRLFSLCLAQSTYADVFEPAYLDLQNAYVRGGQARRRFNLAARLGKPLLRRESVENHVRMHRERLALPDLEAIRAAAHRGNYRQRRHQGDVPIADRRTVIRTYGMPKSRNYMPSKARDSFDENKKDVDQLWQIHEEIAGQGPGRKYGVDVINRAAIVFITACWESFLEDIATEAFNFLLSNVPNALGVPVKVRDLATKAIFEQKDSRKVWDLADGGWRALLKAHRNLVLERWVGSLNTPKTAQVNKLFEELIGISKISSHWQWQNMTDAQAEKKLDEYIAIRGNIAHRTEHNAKVYKNWIRDYISHVSYLVDKSEAAITAHLATATGKTPW